MRQSLMIHLASDSLVINHIFSACLIVYIQGAMDVSNLNAETMVDTEAEHCIFRIARSEACFVSQLALFTARWVQGLFLTWVAYLLGAGVPALGNFAALRLGKLRSPWLSSLMVFLICLR